MSDEQTVMSDEQGSTGTVPDPVRQRWVVPFAEAPLIGETPTFRLGVAPAADERRVQILVRPQRTEVLVDRDVATLPGVSSARTEPELRSALAAADIALNGPDHLFFLTSPQRQRLLATADPTHVRLLTTADATSFAAFQAGVSEADLDDAFVELDHWRVVGAFVGDDLVAAASAYPFEGTSRLADVGVVTRPDVRGRGHGRAVVHALARAVLRAGYEPQYRCQLDNDASVRLARSSGFDVFATWDVAVPTDDL